MRLSGLWLIHRKQDGRNESRLLHLLIKHLCTVQIEREPGSHNKVARYANAKSVLSLYAI